VAASAAGEHAKEQANTKRDCQCVIRPLFGPTFGAFRTDSGLAAHGRCANAQQFLAVAQHDFHVIHELLQIHI